MMKANIVYTIIIVAAAVFFTWVITANRDFFSRAPRKDGKKIGSVIGDFFKRIINGIKELYRNSSPYNKSGKSVFNTNYRNASNSKNYIQQDNDTEDPGFNGDCTFEEYDGAFQGFENIGIDESDESLYDIIYADKKAGDVIAGKKDSHANLNKDLIKITVTSPEDARKHRARECKFSKDDFPVTIGKGRCNITVADKNISNTALEICLKGGELSVTNMGRENILLNDDLLVSGDSQQICSNSNKIQISTTYITVDVYENDILKSLRYITFERSIYDENNKTWEYSNDFTITQKITNADIGYTVPGPNIVLGNIVSINHDLAFVMETGCTIPYRGVDVPVRLKNDHGDPVKIIVPLCEDTVFYLNRCRLKVKSIEDRCIGRGPTEIS